MIRHQKKTFLLLLLALVLAGCNAASNADEQISPDQLLTAAYETVGAELTASAIAQPTATSTPVPSSTPTLTPCATVTGLPTMAPQSNTSYTGQTGSSSVASGDIATFVSDVTIPDGTSMDPGEEFTKTWELQNSGTTTWTSSYELVFYSGKAMSGPSSQQLTDEDVAPGATLYVSVDLTAPSAEGDYVGYWILRNASGENFGIGSYGNPFYVEITVVDPDGTDTPTPTATSTSDGSSTSTPTSTTATTATTVPTATETPAPTETPVPTTVSSDDGGGSE